MHAYNKVPTSFFSVAKNATGKKTQCSQDDLCRRQCAVCDRRCTGVDEIPLLVSLFFEVIVYLHASHKEHVPQDGTCPNGKACTKCSNKPPNSAYIRGTVACAWACNSGFYSQPALDALSAVCLPCTRFNASTCPGGFKFRACSDQLQRDSSCEEACVAEEYGKPMENSEWILSTVDALTQQIVPSTDARLPNIGCLWRCSAGYRELKLEMAGFSICIPNVST